MPLSMLIRIIGSTADNEVSVRSCWITCCPSARSDSVVPLTRTLNESLPLAEPLAPRLPDLLEEAAPLSDASWPELEVEEDCPLRELWSLAPPCALVLLWPLRELALPDLL